MKNKEIYSLDGLDSVNVTIDRYKQLLELEKQANMRIEDYNKRVLLISHEWEYGNRHWGNITRQEVLTNDKTVIKLTDTIEKLSNDVTILREWYDDFLTKLESIQNSNFLYRLFFGRKAIRKLRLLHRINIDEKIY